MTRIARVTAEELKSRYLRSPLNDDIDDDKIYCFSPERVGTIDDGKSKSHPSEFYIIAHEAGDKIVGVAELNTLAENDKRVLLQYVSVDPEYQNRGIATEILTHVFDHVHSLGPDVILNVGDFTSYGDEYLKSIMRMGLEMYPGMLTSDLEDETLEEWANYTPAPQAAL